mmetsp:Transcript_46345/g.108775  ORF Transcript_46345/g.108775 Transcript_46345/m.108775 type:complete len:80 (+) Transcript_46345:76-315(+)
MHILASVGDNLERFFSLPSQVFVLLLLEGINSYRNYGDTAPAVCQPGDSDSEFNFEVLGPDHQCPVHAIESCNAQHISL